MEIYDTTAPDSVSDDHAQESAIGKRAVCFFGTGATIVIGIALYFCWKTGHKAEFAAVGVGYLALAAFAIKIYRSL